MPVLPIWTDYMKGNEKELLVFDRMIYTEYSSYLSHSNNGILVWRKLLSLIIDLNHHRSGI